MKKISSDWVKEGIIQRHVFHFHRFPSLGRVCSFAEMRASILRGGTYICTNIKLIHNPVQTLAHFHSPTCWFTHTCTHSFPFHQPLCVYTTPQAMAILFNESNHLTHKQESRLTSTLKQLITIFLQAGKYFNDLSKWKP